MVHASTPFALELLGSLGGAIGISTAIWLRFVSRKQIGMQYVLAFFGVGVLLLALHTPAWTDLGHSTLVTLRAIVLLAAIVAELYGGWWLWKRAKIDGPVALCRSIYRYCVYQLADRVDA